jgi:hypothetical protein
VVAALGSALLLIGCGGDDSSAEGKAAAVTVVPNPVPLPLGLVQVPGTTAIGRPAVRHTTLLLYGGTPVQGVRLRAAFRLEEADASRVVQAWAEQLAALDIVPNIDVNYGGGDDGIWVSVMGLAGGGPTHAYVNAELWTTDDGLILLVEVVRADGVPTTDGTPSPIAGALPPGEPAPEPPDDHMPSGDVLFVEQKAEMHLPDGARRLTPTLPVFGGTGGSYTVLAADDPRAALQELLDEAVETGEGQGDTEGIVESESEGGVRVLHADFNIPAGGWGFEATAAQGPDDATATIYVRSFAD